METIPTIKATQEVFKPEIKSVEEADIQVLSEIYSRVFSNADPEKPWDIEHSKEHLEYWLKIQPDMFFVRLMKTKKLQKLFSEQCLKKLYKNTTLLLLRL